MSAFEKLIRVLRTRSELPLPALSYKFLRLQHQGGQFSDHPSSRQVAIAERLARLKRRNVPDECFRDRVSMSKWIDHSR